jgi:SET domain-containing protein
MEIISNINPLLEIRDSGEKGVGVYAARAIAKGEFITNMTGFVLETSELTDDVFALQIGKDSWLCSHGDRTDDYINHSCEPNAGFKGGELKLYALHDIAEGEEIVYDYTTCMSDPEWSLECMCGSQHCRRLVLPWFAMPAAFRAAHQVNALAYLQEIEAAAA